MSFLRLKCWIARGPCGPAHILVKLIFMSLPRLCSTTTQSKVQYVWEPKRKKKNLKDFFFSRETYIKGENLGFSLAVRHTYCFIPNKIIWFLSCRWDNANRMHFAINNISVQNLAFKWIYISLHRTKKTMIFQVNQRVDILFHSSIMMHVLSHMRLHDDEQTTWLLFFVSNKYPKI